jgi:hypothetical protein
MSKYEVKYNYQRNENVFYKDGVELQAYYVAQELNEMSEELDFLIEGKAGERE